MARIKSNGGDLSCHNNFIVQHNWKNMPLIAIGIMALFLAGTALVKLGRWLYEKLEQGRAANDE